MSRTDMGRRRGAWVSLVVWAVAALPLTAVLAETPTLDVPFVPTRQAAVEGMLQLAKVTEKDFVIDLGCGDGRIVITAAKKHKAKALGIDLDPRRIKESKANAAKAGVTDVVEFRLGNALKADVSKANVVTLFLLESVNVKLRPRLFAQLKPGSRVVSNTFTMRDWKPDKTLRHPKAYRDVILFWRIPAPAGGTWTWRTKLGGKEVAGCLELEQEFQVVRGTVDPAGGGSVAISDASLAGKELSFTARLGSGTSQTVVAYRGTVEGDEIRGTQQWRGGPNTGTHPWAAKRKAVDLTGAWRIRAASKADHNGTLRIRRTDSGLAATYALDKQPDKKQPLTGFYVWGSSVRFEIPAPESYWSYPLAFRGKLGPDGGGGTVARERSKDRSAWTAKRIADK